MATQRPLVIGATGLPEQIQSGNALVSASVSGTAVLNFGSTPGTNVVTTVVTGQPNIGAASQIQAWLMATATATHNAYEHSVVPMRITCGSVVAGVGFTITAVTDWRLDGTFTVQWTVVL